MNKRTSWLFALLSALVAADAAVEACAVCFRIDEGPVTGGIRAGLVVLLGVTVSVLSAFGLFVVGFIRRSKRMDAS